MSIKIMTRVWDSAEFDGYTLILLLALADSASDEGWCWPCLQTLMKKTRLPERTVYQAMKNLIEAGWLEKMSKRGSKKVYYRVLKGPHAVQTSDAPPLHAMQKRSAHGAVPPHPLIGRTVIEPSGEKRDCVRRVFDYYVKVVGKSNLYDLIDLRMQKGLARLEECLRKTKGDLAGAEEIMRFAVDQISRTGWNMGKNPQKRMYNDWEDQLFGSESRMSKWLEEAIQG